MQWRSQYKGIRYSPEGQKQRLEQLIKKIRHDYICTPGRWSGLYQLHKNHSKVVFFIILNSNFMKSSGNRMLIGKYGHGSIIWVIELFLHNSRILVGKLEKKKMKKRKVMSD